MEGKYRNQESLKDYQEYLFELAVLIINSILPSLALSSSTQPCGNPHTRRHPTSSPRKVKTGRLRSIGPKQEVQKQSIVPVPNREAMRFNDAKMLPLPRGQSLHSYHDYHTRAQATSFSFGSQERVRRNLRIFSGLEEMDSAVVI